MCKYTYITAFSGCKEVRIRKILCISLFFISVHYTNHNLISVLNSRMGEIIIHSHCDPD